MSQIPTSNVESPCVRNCCLNEEDVCLGCGRSLQEITRWSVSSNADKQKTLDTAIERKRLILLRQQGLL